MDKSPLDRIDQAVREGKITGALREALLLGGLVGSEVLREWATQELNGYRRDEVPGYRVLTAPLLRDYRTQTHQIAGEVFSAMRLPEFARVHLSESFPVAVGAAEVELMAAQARESGGFLELGDPGMAELVLLWNHELQGQIHIERVYRRVSQAALQAIMENIANRLVELSAALRSATPGGENLPEKPAADLVARQILNVQGDVVLVEGSGNQITQKSARDEAEAGFWGRNKYLFAGLGAVATVVAGVWGFFA